MKAAHQKLVKANQGHYNKVIEAVALVIRQDRKLLGIPSVRSGLIEAAALTAMGVVGAVTRQTLDSHEDNQEAIVDALNRAVDKGREILMGLPPLRQV
ncbi:hypothetical protein [Methylobacterium ajmalii]|uniref:hypothetical protein n=1 Tax=Methylobacterium ajmalii TaxID=2738439 RepID=UPI002F359C84